MSEEGKEKNPVGKPCKEINKKQFEMLCTMPKITLDFITEFFECSQDAIRNFCKYTYNKTFEECLIEKNQGGRPRKPLDRRIFESLCAHHCTIEEIADSFECAPSTIEEFCYREYGERFSKVWDKKKGRGNISLRHSQFEMSKTIPTMAIWLGKQWLGQKDVQRNELVGDENQPIVTEGTFKVNVYLPDNGRD